MNQFFSFIKKELYHITRDIRTMLMLLLMPIAQLMIFGFAITTEINNIPFAVLDKSKTTESGKLIDEMNGSKYFELIKYIKSDEEIESHFQTGKVKLTLVIPPDFSRDLYHSGATNIQLIADASDPNEASTAVNYAQQIITRYQQELTPTKQIPYVLAGNVKMLYNPQLKSAYNFVPGIMGLILMLICSMMTSISIVREKEQGTMEILLVSPLKPINIVLAKAVPYFLISMIDVISILILSVYVLEVPIAGNIFLLLFLCMIFTFSTLSLGLLISSVTDTQQAAMMISGIGLMLPTLLLSGLIFPVENMPLPLRIISNILPATWFIMAVKDVMIKGLGLLAIGKECLILFSMTVFLLVVSIKMFKNRL
ncbi:MAG: ABC transporter permease [Flavobacteriaceae bacterium]|jgi:ABC-2 type transport system permease protein|nr:ABC transporter permease [Flavobacteriaceae bacterium]